MEVEFKFRQERVKGIEPSSLAWKAMALPLSYTRMHRLASKVPLDHARVAARHGSYST